MKIYIPISFTVFMVLLVFGTPNAVAQKISAKDSIRLNTYLELGNSFISNNMPDSADYYFDLAEELSRSLKYNVGLIKTNELKFKILSRKRSYKEALQLAEENLSLSKELRDQLQIAKALYNRGRTYYNLQNFQFAIINYLEALKIAEVTEDLTLLQNINTSIALVYLNLKENEKSYHYTRRGYELALKNNDTLSLISCLTYLSLIEIYNSNFDKAIDYSKQVIGFGQNSTENNQYLNAYLYLGYSYFRNGDHQNSIKYWLEFVDLYHTIPHSLNRIPYAYYNLAQSFFDLKDYAKANQYFLKCLDFPEILSSSVEFKDIYLIGAKINNQLKNPDLTLMYLEKHEALSDSLTFLEEKENIISFENQLQTYEKEKAITEQKLSIAQKNVEIEAKNKWLFLAFSIVTVLGSCIIIFIIIYRNKQKANAEKLQNLEKENKIKILTAMMEGEEKERSRLARELHDGVGGILSASKMHLSVLQNDQDFTGKSDKFDHTMSLLDNASQEVRTIAHNLSPNILKTYDLEVALSVFCQSVSNARLQIDFYAINNIPKFSSGFNLVVYRTVQELINNIIKHSQADHALVQISQYDELLSLTIEDNGIGFVEQESKGIGLFNLRSRINDMNGQITINSQPGSGTTIYIEFNTSSFLVNPLIKTSIIQ